MARHGDTAFSLNDREHTFSFTHLIFAIPDYMNKTLSITLRTGANCRKGHNQALRHDADARNARNSLTAERRYGQ